MYSDKVYFADMAQSVEHVLGKDGVGSSNLPISSIKKRRTAVSSFFYDIIRCRTPGTSLPTYTGSPKNVCIFWDRFAPFVKRESVRSGARERVFPRNEAVTNGIFIRSIKRTSFSLKTPIFRRLLRKIKPPFEKGCK